MAITMTLANRWWLVALRGVAGIAFGILTFIEPRASLFALIILFGTYAIVDGVFNVATGVRAIQGGRHWGWLVVQGIAGIVAGALTFVWPAMTALVLLMVIAAWSVVTGVSAVAAAIRLRKQISGEWLLGLSGVLSIAFGVVLFLFPGAGALALLLWIGAYAVVFGAVLVALAFRIRAWAHKPEHHLPTTGAPQPA
jgi:uncharacterized membrane protein HdeD (DUF308 family)